MMTQTEFQKQTLEGHINNEEHYNSKLIDEILNGAIKIDYSTINNGYNTIHNTVALSQSLALSNQDLHDCLHGMKDSSPWGRLISFFKGKSVYLQKDIFDRAHDIRAYLSDASVDLQQKAQQLDFATEQIDAFAEQFETKAARCVIAYRALQQKGHHLVSCKKHLETFLEEKEHYDETSIAKRHAAKEKYRQCIRSLHRIRASLNTLKRNKGIYEKHVVSFESVNSLMGRNLETYMQVITQAQSFVIDLEMISSTRSFRDFQESFDLIFNEFEQAYSLIQEHGQAMVGLQNKMNISQEHMKKFDEHLYSDETRFRMQQSDYQLQDPNDFSWLEEDIV